MFIFKKFSSVIVNLDSILSTVGILLCPLLLIYTFMVLENLLYSFAVIMVFFSFLTYFLTKKSFPISFNLNENRELIYCNHFIFNIVFFLLFSLSLILLYFRVNLYSRPSSYFLLVAVMCCVIGINILFTPKYPFKNCIIISQIVLVSTSLQWSSLLLYPSLIGKDPFIHEIFTLSIMNSGHIPENFVYSKLPIFHLIIAMFSTISGIGYKYSAAFSISFSCIIIHVLFIFLLGKLLFNENVGLLGSLFLVTANRYIQMGFWPVPNTLATSFVLPLFYFFALNRYKFKCTYNLMSLLLMFLLILCHSLTSLWFSILLFSFFLCYNLFEWSRGFFVKKNIPMTLGLLLVFNVSMYSWWVFASGHFGTLLRLLQSGFDLDKVMLIIPMYQLSFAGNIINYFGMFLFFSMSFIGCFYMISKFSDRNSFSLSIAGLMTVAITFFGQVSGKYIVTGRWEYFSYIVLALPLSVSVYLIYSKIKSKYIAPFFFIAFIFILIFSMIISETANFDNGVVTSEPRIRYAFTESEINALNRVMEMGSADVYTDSLYQGVGINPTMVKYFNGGDLGINNIKILDSMLYNKDISKIQSSPIVIRKEILGKPINIYRTVVILNYSIIDLLDENKLSRIYDCGSSFAYIL